MSKWSFLVQNTLLNIKWYVFKMKAAGKLSLAYLDIFVQTHHCWPDTQWYVLACVITLKNYPSGSWSATCGLYLAGGLHIQVAFRGGSMLLHPELLNITDFVLNVAGRFNFNKWKQDIMLLLMFHVIIGATRWKLTGVPSIRHFFYKSYIVSTKPGMRTTVLLILGWSYFLGVPPYKNL